MVSRCLTSQILPLNSIYEICSYFIKINQIKCGVLAVYRAAQCKVCMKKNTPFSVVKFILRGMMSMMYTVVTLRDLSMGLVVS